MKKLTALVVGAVLMMATSAMAMPIRLDTNTQPDDSGDATVKSWLVDVIVAYNGSHDPDLSTNSLDVTSYGRWNTDDPAQGSYPNFGDDVTNINLPSNLNTYLVLHWGGNSANLGFNTYQAYALDNLEAFHDFLAPGQQGLSWYEFFGTHEPPNPVPEPGTMMLLGIGMFGMAIYGKRRMHKES